MAVALSVLSEGGGCGDGAEGEVDVTLAHFAGGKSGVSGRAYRAYVIKRSFCPRWI